MQDCNGAIHLAGLSNWKEIQSPLLGEVVVGGSIKAWEHGQPGEHYILGGDNLTLRELVTLVLELLGQQKRMIAIPTFLPILWLFYNILPAAQPHPKG